MTCIKNLSHYECKYIEDKVIRVGDLIFYESTTFMGSVIRKITGYKYSHVAIVVDIDDNDIWVLEAVAFKKTKIVSLFKDKNIKSLMVSRPCGMDDEKREKIYKMRNKYVGHRYDHFGVIHLAMCLIFPNHKKEHSRLKTTGKWCSAIVDQMIYKVGIDLIPENLDSRIDIKTLAESKNLYTVRHLTANRDFRYL